MQDVSPDCPWEKIGGFRSPGEFARFRAWMEELINDGQVGEIAVASPYIGAATMHEAWFQHRGSGEIWRLVWPDPPFTGVFERVPGNTGK